MTWCRHYRRLMAPLLLWGLLPLPFTGIVLPPFWLAAVWTSIARGTSATFMDFTNARISQFLLQFLQQRHAASCNADDVAFADEHLGQLATDARRCANQDRLLHG